MAPNKNTAGSPDKFNNMPLSADNITMHIDIPAADAMPTNFAKFLISLFCVFKFDFIILYIYFCPRLRGYFFVQTFIIFEIPPFFVNFFIIYLYIVFIWILYNKSICNIILMSIN